MTHKTRHFLSVFLFWLPILIYLGHRYLPSDLSARDLAAYLPKDQVELTMSMPYEALRNGNSLPAGVAGAAGAGEASKRVNFGLVDAQFGFALPLVSSLRAMYDEEGTVDGVEFILDERGRSWEQAYEDAYYLQSQLQSRHWGIDRTRAMMYYRWEGSEEYEFLSRGEPRCNRSGVILEAGQKYFALIDIVCRDIGTSQADEKRFVVRVTVVSKSSDNQLRAYNLMPWK